MKNYMVEIKYYGIINEIIEAESQSDAEFQAHDISVMEVPSDAETDTIDFWEV